MMRVLVTGADGFVGRALCPFLQARGYAVRAALRRLDPFPGDALHGVDDRAAVEEIGPETDWEAALAGMDAVVHLAARTHVMRETAPNPLAAYRTVNLLGAERLVKAAARQGVRRFVLLSTVHVLGERSGATPLSENDPPHPAGPYAQSKWEAEQMLWRVAGETGLAGVVVRPPLLYGPGVKGNFLRLLRWVERGVPLPLAGVNNRRSLCGVTNLADLLEHCLRRPEAAGETFLAADGEDLSTPELIRRIARMMGRPARLFHLPPAPLGLAARLAGFGGSWSRLAGSLAVNADKNRTLLGRREPESVEEGLARTVRWYRETGAS
jgi:nucleoside-diphosphate-sugar epimerase